MSSDDTGSSKGSNCAKVGCGCAGMGGVVIAGIGILYWFFTDALFYYPSAGYGLLFLIPVLIVGAVAGAFGGKSLFGEGGSLGIIARRRMQDAGKIFLGFGMLCVVTAVGMSMRSGFHYEGTASGWKTPDGKVVQVGDAEVTTDSLGILGPIEVPKGNMEVGVRVQQEIKDGVGSTYERWNFITVTLLDENKDYLLSFGGDVWNYAGYSGGEDWHEEDTRYATTLEFPSLGTYYLRIRAESGTGSGSSFTSSSGDDSLDPSDMYPIHVELYERARWGNPWPVWWAAYLGFFFGIFGAIASRIDRGAQVKRHLENGGAVQYDGKTWRVGSELHCTYSDWMATEWSLQPTDPGAKMPRYLEHEYEIGSDWENWLISEPVDLDELTCEGSDGSEMTVQQYVERHGELPEEVSVDDRPYKLEGSGTMEREETSIRYHNYEGIGEDFVTIEGRPGESLDAVVGESISLSDLSIVAEESDSK